jgi:uncharacterized protein (TIGR03492 family)
MRLLCLSNGHGEDIIALRILQALQRHPNAPTIEVLPIVGEGHLYTNAGFPLIGQTKTLPSGGFLYMDNKQLARDIRGGLVQLTRSQIQAIRQWGKASNDQPSLILAVGDIVPMLFAWQSGLPYAFVGTAKSEYYLRDEHGWLARQSWWDDRLQRWNGCVYYPWERWLMTRPQCRAVFPRDRLTSETLQRLGVPAVDAGNPMMDGLGAIVPPPPPQPTDSLKIVLLPGSRIPEAYENWQLIIQAVENLGRVLGRSVKLLAAVTPTLEMLHLKQSLQGWQEVAQNTYQSGSEEYFTELTICPGKFVECIRTADLAIAMAGTATEQFVGLGKPVITLPGAGPQFVPTFAEAQTRLLGASVNLVQHPNQVSEKIKTLLDRTSQWPWYADNGQRRMGLPGAAERIAACLVQQLEGAA